MNVAKTISQRSTCDRGKPGCVFVKNNQILATGYAGSPPGLPHCDEVGHGMEERIRFINEKDFCKLHPDIKDPSKVNIEFSYGPYVYKPTLKRYELPPSQHCVRTTHAEMNAIIQAARRGTALEGSTVYVTMTPCRDCTKALITVGVVEVVADKLYQKAQDSLDMFAKVGIKVTHLDNSIQEYNK